MIEGMIEEMIEMMDPIKVIRMTMKVIKIMETMFLKESKEEDSLIMIEDSTQISDFHLICL